MIKQMKKITAALIPFIFMFTGGFSQSTFLETGESGYSIYSSIASGENLSKLGAGIMFSSKGTADMRISYSAISINSETKIVGISFGGALHFLKQSETIPVSMAISGDMSFYTQEADNTGIGVGASVYRRFSISSRISLIPSLGGKIYSTGDRKRDSSYAIGAAILFSRMPGFYIEPTLQMVEDFYVFGITFGVLHIR